MMKRAAWKWSRPKRCFFALCLCLSLSCCLHFLILAQTHFLLFISYSSLTLKHCLSFKNSDFSLLSIPFLSPFHSLKILQCSKTMVLVCWKTNVRCVQLFLCNISISSSESRFTVWMILAITIFHAKVHILGLCTQKKSTGNGNYINIKY